VAPIELLSLVFEPKHDPQSRFPLWPHLWGQPLLQRTAATPVPTVGGTMLQLHHLLGRSTQLHCDFAFYELRIAALSAHGVPALLPLDQNDLVSPAVPLHVDCLHITCSVLPGYSLRYSLQVACVRNSTLSMPLTYAQQRSDNYTGDGNEAEKLEDSEGDDEDEDVSYDDDEKDIVAVGNSVEAVLKAIWRSLHEHISHSTWMGIGRDVVTQAVDRRRRHGPTRHIQARIKAEGVCWVDGLVDEVTFAGLVVSEVGDDGCVELELLTRAPALHELEYVAAMSASDGC
jgi:hypothetical protein